MPYFADNYSRLAYPVASGPVNGLFNAQLGAIHAVAAHFAVDERRAMVTMPTGSGKTAVLMMVPFILRSERTLVITPSRMVREQIVEDFGGLITLRQAGAIPNDVRSPKVVEIKKRIRSADDWEALRPAEVVVSTPNCVSPAYTEIPPIPGDLFDLVLVDEAHHSSASTWAELLAAVPSNIRKVLFTATPFRRDDKEINARIIFNYPVQRAFADGIFGQIRYVAVELPDGATDSDIAIAKKTEEVFRADRAANLNHYVMVRTDGQKRADELADIYSKNTSLRLEVIHSGIAVKHVKKSLSALETGDLDGIICVNMLGEGFNFPRLKIAAIHAPHRSLEVTLQFIGRFARTNAPDIGEAKFVAIQNDIELEGERLFDSRAVWQNIILDLGYGRIAAEVAVREEIDRFDRPEGDEDIRDLSLYSLHPRSHVKILDVRNVAVDLTSSAPAVPGWGRRYQNLTNNDDTLILIYRRTAMPKWSASDLVVDSEHYLLILHHDRDRGLLFINSSESVDGVYELFLRAFAPGASRLSLFQVRRVVRRLREQRIFNFGLRTIQATHAAESYRILAGPNPAGTISPIDARLFKQGHAFHSGVVDGEKVTLGYSSGSKVWASGSDRVPGLIKWCASLASEIRSETAVVTNSGLDYVPVGQVVATMPTNIVLATWNRDAFDVNEPARVEYQGDDGTLHRELLMNIDVRIDAQTAGSLNLSFVGPSVTYRATFGLSPDQTEFYEAAQGQEPERIKVTHGLEPLTLIEYLNIRYLDFYTADGGVLSGNEQSVSGLNAEPLDRNQLEAHDWTGVDIESELTDSQQGLSIFRRMTANLAASEYDVVFSDHGSGEMSDFVCIKKDNEALCFRLVHCKGSEKSFPGARVKDVYEVCGQAQKSVIWADLGRILKRLTPKIDALDFIRGSKETLMQLFGEADQRMRRFEVVVAQPGISAAAITPALLENLGATSGHLTRSGFQPLRVIVSA